MAGLFTYLITGVGFLLIGALESLSPLLPAALSLPLRFLAAFLLSSLAFLSSLISSIFYSSGDPLARSLALSSLAVAAFFLLYSVAGLLSFPSSSRSFLIPFTSPLLDFFLCFAFGQEFILFYLRRKDVDGVENRYFDLLLVPILICVVSTVLAAARPRKLAPQVARAAGLVLQGTWFIQMGFSFFTNLIVHGCAIHSRSSVNYTIKCKTHQDYHRGRAIATLQFNSHLALLVLVGAAVYGVVVGKMGGAYGYRPLSKELQQLGDPNFTLVADGDDEEEITADTRGDKRHEDAVLPVTEVNGLSSSH